VGTITFCYFGVELVADLLDRIFNFKEKESSFYLISLFLVAFTLIHTLYIKFYVLVKVVFLLPFFHQKFPFHFLMFKEKDLGSFIGFYVLNIFFIYILYCVILRNQFHLYEIQHQFFFIQSAVSLGN
jgi:hypothetical protein